MKNLSKKKLLLEKNFWKNSDQKKSLFPFVNFTFSHYEIWVQG